MSKLAVRLMGFGLALGMGMGAAPAFAQDSGIANTANDFPSADAGDGIGGSNVDVWDLFHNLGSLSAASQVDEGFYRSQSRRINRQAESLRERQRAIIEQRAAETAATESELETAE
ncbi:MAG: hypothetical protein AAFQ63_04190 [Cyanobacteria bacterium J06621_11]